MRFVYNLPVRYADTDAQGHVFFANYLTFFDEALTYYLEAVGVPYLSMEEDEGVLFVYANAQCRYFQSIRFGDPLQVHAAITRLGNSSMTTALRAMRGDVLAAEGELVSVCLGADDRQKRPLPQRLRDAVSRYEGESEKTRQHMG